MSDVPPPAGPGNEGPRRPRFDGGRSPQGNDDGVIRSRFVPPSENDAPGRQSPADERTGAVRPPSPAPRPGRFRPDGAPDAPRAPGRFRPDGGSRRPGDEGRLRPDGDPRARGPVRPPRPRAEAEVGGIDGPTEENLRPVGPPATESRGGHGGGRGGQPPRGRGWDDDADSDADPEAEERAAAVAERRKQAADARREKKRLEEGTVTRRDLDELVKLDPETLWKAVETYLEAAGARENAKEHKADVKQAKLRAEALSEKFQDDEAARKEWGLDFPDLAEMDDGVVTQEAAVALAYHRAMGHHMSVGGGFKAFFGLPNGRVPERVPEFAEKARNVAALDREGDVRQALDSPELRASLIRHRKLLDLGVAKLITVPSHAQAALESNAAHLLSARAKTFAREQEGLQEAILEAQGETTRQQALGATALTQSQEELAAARASMGEALDRAHNALERFEDTSIFSGDDLLMPEHSATEYVTNVRDGVQVEPYSTGVPVRQTAGPRLQIAAKQAGMPVILDAIELFVDQRPGSGNTLASASDRVAVVKVFEEIQAANPGKFDIESVGAAPGDDPSRTPINARFTAGDRVTLTDTQVETLAGVIGSLTETGGFRREAQAGSMMRALFTTSSLSALQTATRAKHNELAGKPAPAPSRSAAD